MAQPHPEQVQQVVEGHELQIQALNAQVQTLLEKIDHLRNIIDNKPARRPKPCLPDPDKFSGAPFTWDTWLPSIQAKLRIDGAAIGGPEAQFFYLYGRLEGKVQSLVTPQLTVAEATQEYDPAALLTQLARIYDDPNKTRDAEDKLQAIKQGEDPLPTYLAKFERLLYKAQANTWPDNTKIALLRRGLNRTTRARLDVQLNVPQQYDAFVATLQKLVSRNSASNNFGNHGNRAGGDPMDTHIGALAVFNADEN